MHGNPSHVNLVLNLKDGLGVMFTCQSHLGDVLPPFFSPAARQHVIIITYLDRLQVHSMLEGEEREKRKGNMGKAEGRERDARKGSGHDNLHLFILKQYLPMGPLIHPH